MTTDGRRRSRDAASLATFVALGLPDGMLGTAWPALRHSFGVPVGDLGLVLLVATAGSVMVTLFVGRLIRRLGVPSLLAIGLLCAAAAGAGFAAAPVFAVILGVALLFGVAAGLLDGGLNTAVGLAGRRRLLNLLHAAYGVGTAIGPLLVTVAVVVASWRPAYVALLVIDLVLAAGWLHLGRGRARPLTASGSSAARHHPDQEEISVRAFDVQPSTVAGAGRLRRSGAPRRGASGGAGRGASGGVDRSHAGGAVGAGIAVFFVYTGLEVSAGQWEATFGRSHLHLSAAAAGVATFGYWAALTAVRIALALLPRPPAHQSVVRWGCLVAVGAAGLIWSGAAVAVSVAGFVVMGAALAGVFPALIALTPIRLGERRASTVIAWQVGAAAAGGAGLSAAVGLLIGASGVAVLGPSLLVLAVLLVVLEMALTRLAPLPS